MRHPGVREGRWGLAQASTAELPRAAATPSPGQSMISRALHLKLVPLWLGVILLGAALLRFAGQDWDAGQHLHPDERFLSFVETGLKWPGDRLLASYFNEPTSTLNPANVGFASFSYGDFPVIFVKVVATALHQTDYSQVYLVGRTVAALVDLGTLVLIFLLARTLYRDNRVALLAALFYSLSALAIQQAHFFVVDGFAVFFVTAALYFMARIFHRNRLRDYLLAGTCIGAALASKFSVYPIAEVLLIVGAYRVYVDVRDPEQHPGRVLGQVAMRLAIAALAIFLCFRILQPYAFQGPGLLGISLSHRWLKAGQQIQALATGRADVPYGYQWTDRPAIIFPLENLVLWGMGLPLGVAACAGWVAAAWQLVRHRRWIHLLPVVWTALLLGVLGLQWFKYMRYFLPVYPTLCLLAGWLLVTLYDAGRRPRMIRVARRIRLHWTASPAIALIGLVVTGTLLYAIAVGSIYLRPHSRIVASQWIYSHIGPGSVVANESAWDDSLPLPLPRVGDASRYQSLNLGLTDEDTPLKMQHMLSVLDQADYLLISSNRQYASLVRLPERFPMTVKYYDALFSGRLGFSRVADFTSYPQLLGIRLADQGADESWTVYDHPRVQVFQKTSRYSHALAARLFVGVNWNEVLQLLPKQATDTHHAMLLTPTERAAAQQGGTWSGLFSPASIVNRFPVLVWALLLVLLGFLAFPLVWLAARALPDRGYAFARPAGLLLVGWLVWWLASVKLLPFSASTIALALVAIGLVSGALAAWQRAALFGWLRANLRVVLVEEAVFWGAFVLVLAVRWANPDLWHPSLGGEKPMDFAFLNAVIKSTYFPPYDPWFAGGYINYYYFGLVLVGTLVKLTGIVPAVAYNLAIPTFFAFLAAAAFGATLALTTSPRERPVGRRALGLPLLAVVLIALAGNLGELRFLIAQLAGAVTGHPALLPIQAWYWDATRLIQHPPTEAGPITEFPWFTYLYADLHAHLLALPYTVLALALAVGLVREIARPSGPWRRVMGLVPLSFVLGALWPLNTWDFPTYALVALGALLVASWRRSATPLKALLDALGSWVIVVALGYALFLPFHLRSVSPFAGLEPWRGSPTPLADYLTIHGLFLFLIVAALLVDFWFGRDLNPSARLIRLGLRRWRHLPRLVHLHRVLVSGTPLYRAGLCVPAVGGLLAVLLVFSRKPLLTLIVVLGTLATLLAVRGRTANAEGPTALQQRLWQMTLVLVIGGLALTLAAELVVPTGIDIGRVNTVFKLYLQAWVLWGLAATAAVGTVVRNLPRLPTAGRMLWSSGFVALLSGALLYPVLATPAKINDRFDRSVGGTLDGTRFMEKAVYVDRSQEFPLVYDSLAMGWLEQHVSGSPVVAEVNTSPTLYGWGDRYAMFTGNPTVIGWSWHEQQQRPVDAALIARRIAAIQLAYSTTVPTLAYQIFHQYGVDYFVVGPLERAYFPAGQQKWDQGRDRLWDTVYENPGVVIYRLRPSEANAYA